MAEQHDDEKIIHYEECIASLSRSWKTIKKLQEIRCDSVIWNAAYQMALIDYTKPFTQSRGVHKRHCLEFPEHFSGDDRDLHERLMNLRHQFLAHSDISIKDAKVYRQDMDGYSYPLIISNTDPQLPKSADVSGLIQRLLRYVDQLAAGVYDS